MIVKRLSLRLAALAAVGLCLVSCGPNRRDPGTLPAGASSASADAPARIPAPPIAPVRVVTDTYHGTKVDDPYRYMENLEDPEVASWFRGQADHTAAVLGSLPGREAMMARIKELDASVPYWASPPVRRPNGDRFYYKKFTEEQQGKYHRIDHVTSEDRVVLDPELLSTPGHTASVAYVLPSLDGKLLLYGVSFGGSEATELRLREVSSGVDLPLSIDRIETAYNTPMWLPDSSGFVYARRQLLPPGAPATDGYKLTAAYVHRLGDDPSTDVKILAKDLSADVPMADSDFPSVFLPPGSEFVLGQVKIGDNPELTLYSAPRSQLGTSGIRWKPICSQSDGVTGFAVHGSTIYLTTTSQAPRLKVVSTALDNPDFARAAEVVPASDLVVQSVSAARDALYVNISDGAVLGVLRVPYDNPRAAKRLTPPNDQPSMSGSAEHALLDGAMLWTSSWTRAGRTFAYNPDTGALTDVTATPRGRYDDPEDITAEEVSVRSHDGVMVPLSIIHRKDMKLDGSNPCLLSGYGAYGMSTYPWFDCIQLSWMEHGGIIAIAHIRGGGELGKPWHEAGRMKTKPNTWKDFIACAQYLVDKKYTSPAHLAGEGGSAGGILIGRAITERPDLFGAAIISVGATDMLRMETTTNGVPNIHEFGSTATPEGFASLREMSAYDHVKPGVAYPAVLLIHGMNDPRVNPWMSGKMAARLQAASTSGKPVLLRVDYDSGHGGGGTTDQWRQLATDRNLFLLSQLGRH